MRKTLEDWEDGISVGGKKMSNLSYADATLVIATSAEELKIIMTNLERSQNQQHYDQDDLQTTNPT